MTLTVFISFVLLCVIYGNVVGQATGADCNMPGYVYWPGAYSPQGTISTWPFAWSTGGRQRLMGLCNSLDACLAFSDPGELKGFLRPVGGWAWTSSDNLLLCLGTYVKEAVSANISSYQASLARGAAMAAAAAAASSFEPLTVGSSFEPLSGTSSVGTEYVGTDESVVGSRNNSGNAENSAGGPSDSGASGGSTLIGSGNNDDRNSGRAGSRSFPAAELAARTAACNDSSNLIPGFQFYPNRFIENAQAALEMTSVILDEMVIVQPQVVAAACFRLSWCYAFDTTGRIWGDLTKLSLYADMLRHQSPLWKPTDVHRRGVCGGTYLRVTPDIAGCTSRLDYMLYPGSYPSSDAYRTLPGGATLDDLLGACSSDSPAPCAAAQYPEMLLLAEPPAAAMMYDVPPAPTGSCMGTYVRLPAYFNAKSDGVYETVAFTQQFNSSAPSLLNFSTGGVSLNFSSAAHLIEAPAGSDSGSQFGLSFGAAAPGCMCSAFIKVILTLTSTVHLPTGNAAAPSDTYGTLVFAVQRADGSLLSYSWRMVAPMTSGLVTSQVTLYYVSVRSSRDAVTVAATNEVGFNSLNARLTADVTVRSLTATLLPSPSPVLTGPATTRRDAKNDTLPAGGLSAEGSGGKKSDSNVSIGLLIGAIVGAIIAVLSMTAAFLTLYMFRNRGRKLQIYKQLDTTPSTPPPPALGASGAGSGSSTADADLATAPPSAAGRVDSPTVFIGGAASVTAAVLVRDIPNALKTGAVRTISGATGKREHTDRYSPAGGDGSRDMVTGSLLCDAGQYWPTYNWCTHPMARAAGCWGCRSWWPVRGAVPSAGDGANWRCSSVGGNGVGGAQEAATESLASAGPQASTGILYHGSVGGGNMLGDRAGGSNCTGTSSVLGTQEGVLACSAGSGLPVVRVIWPHQQRTLRGPDRGGSTSDIDKMDISSVQEVSARPMDRLLDTEMADNSNKSAGIAAMATDAARGPSIMDAVAVGIQRIRPHSVVLSRAVELASSVNTWPCATPVYKGTSPAPSITVDLASGSMEFDLEQHCEISARISGPSRRQKSSGCSTGRSSSTSKPFPPSGASTLNAVTTAPNNLSEGHVSAQAASTQPPSGPQELPCGDSGSVVEGRVDAIVVDESRDVRSGQQRQFCGKAALDVPDNVSGAVQVVLVEQDAAAAVLLEVNQINSVQMSARAWSSPRKIKIADATKVLGAGEELEGEGEDGKRVKHWSQTLPQPCIKTGHPDRASSSPVQESYGTSYIDCVLCTFRGFPLVRSAKPGPSSASDSGSMGQQRSMGATPVVSSSFHTATGGWSLASGAEDVGTLVSSGRVPSLSHLTEEQSRQDQLEGGRGQGQDRPESPDARDEWSHAQRRNGQMQQLAQIQGLEHAYSTQQQPSTDPYGRLQQEQGRLQGPEHLSTRELGVSQGGAQGAHLQQQEKLERHPPSGPWRVQGIMGPFLLKRPTSGRNCDVPQHTRPSALPQTAEAERPTVPVAADPPASAAAAPSIAANNPAVGGADERGLVQQRGLCNADTGNLKDFLQGLQKNWRQQPDLKQQEQQQQQHGATQAFAEPWLSQLAIEESGGRQLPPLPPLAVGCPGSSFGMMLPNQAAAAAVTAWQHPSLSTPIPSSQLPHAHPRVKQLQQTPQLLPFISAAPSQRQSLPPVYSVEDCVRLHQLPQASCTARDAPLSPNAVPDPLPTPPGVDNARVAAGAAPVPTVPVSGPKRVLEAATAAGARAAPIIARHSVSASVGPVPDALVASGSLSTCTSTSVLSSMVSTVMGGSTMALATASVLAAQRSTSTLAAASASGSGGATGSGSGGASGASSNGVRGIFSEEQSWSNPLLKVVLGENPLMEDVDLYISPEDLQLNALIGKGASGEVYHALWRGQQVAVKKLLDGYHQQQEMRTLLQEMAILTRARHPNIVRCYGGCLQPPKVFLVEELLVCSLHDFIYHPHGDHSPLKLLSLARDVALGLAYLHPTILHRDLKPSNILIDMNGRAKIADFGLARYKLRTHLSTHNLEAGTTPYLPPEVFDQLVKHLTDRSDVYSLGIIMWELFTRQPPWHNMRDVAIAYNVHVNRARPQMPSKDRCPPRLTRLIQACWAHRPRDRPSAAEVVKELTLTIAQLEMQ